MRSASPEVRHSTNLKIVVQQYSNGNLDPTYSLTTRLISGHNTPLAYMKQKALKRVNDD
jgi:hypothetical protein